MPIEIENPKTAEFLSLHGAFNFQYKFSRFPNHPNVISFDINWTKEGDGQEILKEHLRLKTPLRLRHHEQEYRGIVSFHNGINSAEGIVAVNETAG